MNKMIRVQSIIAGASLLLALVLPGCQPEDKGESETSYRTAPTPAPSDRSAEKGIHPRKAKWSREWEE